MGMSTVTGEEFGKRVPSKVSFFVWTLLHNGVQTQANLKRQGCSLVERCAFCSLKVEDVYLFVQCEYTTFPWCYFFRITQGRIEGGEVNVDLLINWNKIVFFNR